MGDVRLTDGVVGADQVPVAGQAGDRDALLLQVRAPCLAGVGIVETFIEELAAELDRR